MVFEGQAVGCARERCCAFDKCSGGEETSLHVYVPHAGIRKQIGSD